MRRRSQPGLFDSDEPDVYCVDTSSWGNIDKRPDRDEVWKLIVGLIERGRIVACPEVLEELRNYDHALYVARFKPYERALQAGARKSNDMDYLAHVGRITFDHPEMSRATSTRNHADAYVVALAELEGYVVVADESCKKRPNRKIPGVCKKRNIRCLTLSELVAAVKKDGHMR
jgi:hypothetical protein